MPTPQRNFLSSSSNTSLSDEVIRERSLTEDNIITKDEAVLVCDVNGLRSRWHIALIIDDQRSMTITQKRSCSINDESQPIRKPLYAGNINNIQPTPPDITAIPLKYVVHPKIES